MILVPLILLAMVTSVRAFCGRQACSAMPAPAGPDITSRCVKETTCCTMKSQYITHPNPPGLGAMGPQYIPTETHITAVDLSPLSGLAIPGTDMHGNAYTFDACAVATPLTGCMRAVVDPSKANGSHAYSTLLWKRNAINGINGCAEMNSYVPAQCIVNRWTDYKYGYYHYMNAPLYPGLTDCNSQYLSNDVHPAWATGNNQSESTHPTTSIAGWSTNDLGDGPLTLTFAAGKVVTGSFPTSGTFPYPPRQAALLRVSFICNPESVVPQEPFNYVAESTAASSPSDITANITIYTSLVCKKGKHGYELQDYQKQQQRLISTGKIEL